MNIIAALVAITLFIVVRHYLIKRKDKRIRQELFAQYPILFQKHLYVYDSAYDHLEHKVTGDIFAGISNSTRRTVYLPKGLKALLTANGQRIAAEEITKFYKEYRDAHLGVIEAKLRLSTFDKYYNVKVKVPQNCTNIDPLVNNTGAGDVCISTQMVV